MVIFFAGKSNSKSDCFFFLSLSLSFLCQFEASIASVSLVVTFTQTGSDVVINATGAIDTSGASGPFVGSNTPSTWIVKSNPVVLGVLFNGAVSQYSFSSGVSVAGQLVDPNVVNLVKFANSATSGVAYILIDGTANKLEFGGETGQSGIIAVDKQMLFQGESLSSLGLPSTGTATVTYGANRNTIVFVRTDSNAMILTE